MNESIILNAIEGLSARIDKMDQKIEAMDQKFTEKFEAIDEKVDFIDKKFTRKFDAVEARLSSVEEMQSALKTGQEHGFAKLSGEINALSQRFTEFEEKNEREHEEFRQAIGMNQY